MNIKDLPRPIQDAINKRNEYVERAKKQGFVDTEHILGIGIVMDEGIRYVREPEPIALIPYYITRSIPKGEGAVRKAINSLEPNSYDFIETTQIELPDPESRRLVSQGMHHNSQGDKLDITILLNR